MSRPSKEVTCIVPRNSLLTYGKKYEVVKAIHDSYVIRRDDGSIDKMATSRFIPSEKFNDFAFKREISTKGITAYLKSLLREPETFYITDIERIKPRK
jgi:hypothetical protein